MHTRYIVAAILCTLLSGGCASSPNRDLSVLPATDSWLNQAEDCCHSRADLQTTALRPHQELELTFGPGTPVHVFDSGKSPFHALTLPRQAGPVKLSWVSDVNRAPDGTLTLFAPTVLLLDTQSNVKRRFDWQDFDYRPASGFSPDRLSLSLSASPGDMADRVVVMTSRQALAAGTQLLHPARAYARARHWAEPDIANPVAAHRASGRVTLTVRPLGEASGLSASLLGAGQAPSERPVEPAVTPSPTPGSLHELGYRRLMRAALEANDIALAMQLAERAQRAGDEDARQWLAEQLRTK